MGGDWAHLGLEMSRTQKVGLWNHLGDRTKCFMTLSASYILKDCNNEPGNRAIGFKNDQNDLKMSGLVLDVLFPEAEDAPDA